LKKYGNFKLRRNLKYPSWILLKAKHLIIYAMCKIEFNDREFRKMKRSNGIQLLKFCIEKVWKTIFKNVWEPWREKIEVLVARLFPENHCRLFRLSSAKQIVACKLYNWSVSELGSYIIVSFTFGFAISDRDRLQAVSFNVCRIGNFFGPS